MNSLRRLILLLAQVPPLPRGHFVFAIALVAVYLLLMRTEATPGPDVAVPFLLANVAAYLAAGLFGGRPGSFDARAVFALSTLTAGWLLWMGDPAACQRIVTAFLLVRAAGFAWGLMADRAFLADLIRRCGWGGEPENCARWEIVGCVSLILVNEAVTMHGTLADWILVRALAPIAIYHAVHWTILATADEA